MIEIPMNIDLYTNTQVYFAKNILPELPNDNFAWQLGYRNWLLDQGCELVPHMWVCKNTLGVSPGFDKFRFHNEQDATSFVLRWQ